MMILGASKTVLLMKSIHILVYISKVRVVAPGPIYLHIAISNVLYDRWIGQGRCSMWLLAHFPFVSVGIGRGPSGNNEIQTNHARMSIGERGNDTDTFPLPPKA